MKKVDSKTAERIMNANLQQKIKDFVNYNCKIVGGKVESVDICYVTPPQFGKLGHFLAACYLYKTDIFNAGPTMLVNGELYQNLTIQKVCASHGQTGKWVDVKNIKIVFQEMINN